MDWLFQLLKFFWLITFFWLSFFDFYKLKEMALVMLISWKPEKSAVPKIVPSIPQLLKKIGGKIFSNVIIYFKILFFFFLNKGGGCCLVTQSYPTLCDPMNCSLPGFPVLHYLLEFAQTQVHWISYAIQPLPSPSPPAFSLSQHQDIRWPKY